MLHYGGRGCQLLGQQQTTTTTTTSPSFSLHRCNPLAPHSLSSLAYEPQADDNDDTDTGISHDNDNDERSPRQQRRRPPPTSNNDKRIILPTKHSRHLPPPACPPSQLRKELHFLLNESSTLGSLIAYPKPKDSTTIKTVSKEIEDAYLASDPVVQRVEYVMRGLNACLSPESFVSRSIQRGSMAMDNNDNEQYAEEKSKVVDEKSKIMEKGECLRAMFDLIERMVKEGEAYAEVRSRVRSQVLDPSATYSSSSDGNDSSSDSSSSSSDDDEKENGDSGSGEFDERAADESFNKWAETMNRNMSKIGIANKSYAGGRNAEQQQMEMDDDEPPPMNNEMYQFGADPGLTIHMYDLALDGLACLCHETSSSSSWSSVADVFYSLPGGATSPPELAKSLLDAGLRRHWLDGGDVGLDDGGSMGGIGRGVGVGAGTGAGSLWNSSSSSSGNYDVRTCPTPMTFNTVLRVTANFNPNAYAQAMEDVRVLQGGYDMKNPIKEEDRMAREKERLRDVTIDAALSTYSRMLECSALTLRALGDSTRLATSRSVLKKRARILDGNYKGKRRREIVSGRNAATYAYIIRTIGNIIPPSLSRGNMTFALYQKGVVEEGILDEQVVRAMMSVGGYDGDAIGVDVDSDVPVSPLAPPVSNGPLFDSFLQKDLGRGIKAALDEGRKLRRDKNYKTRRSVEWDGTY